MTDERQKTVGWWGVVLALLLLPVLYVVSAGPAIAVVDRTGKGEEVFEIIYAPLEGLAQNTPLKKPLGWYVGLWEK